MVVIALGILGAVFSIMTLERAMFLLAIYASFMVIYNLINAKFLSQDKFQILIDEGQTKFGNPIDHNSRFGRILHYMLFGLIASIAIGSDGADPAAYFRGFSQMGLLFAGAYGLFSEMQIRHRNKKANNQKDK